MTKQSLASHTLKPEILIAVRLSVALNVAIILTDVPGERTGSKLPESHLPSFRHQILNKNRIIPFF